MAGLNDFEYGNTKRMAKEAPMVASDWSGIRIFQAWVPTTGAAIYSVGIVRFHDFRFVIRELAGPALYDVFIRRIKTTSDITTFYRLESKQGEESCQTEIKPLNQRTLHPPKLPT